MSEHPENAHAGLPAPRVLVAEDDPCSCRFLEQGLRSLGAIAHACRDGDTALARACAEPFDLMLLDCHMPHGGALQILAQLRGDSRAASRESVAVATSAELPSSERRRLIAVGFSDALLKPCTLTDLRRVLALVPIQGPAGALDDRAALCSSGDVSTMRALRQLLRQELALLKLELESLTHDLDAFADRLHRLRSSCGFCGATALARQVVLTQQHLSRDGLTPAALASFREAIDVTLEALDG